ncbi:restriction endonuclease subunit S [Bacteroides fragilis]|jgi:type I restriction enzyme S subunit|uniref:restriction endonuclease subunit S n=1 Tax=Bacteroides fragilis TaxID=817 RepID=UPI0015F37E74|nr:restriction endonuclease subunit S [Bacteroides fragilis]MBA5646579.1 restriction endonuclease subunit S [Bacteroides fragilis]
MKETRFKQTEIGLIPEDWDITYIEKECKVGTGSKNTQDKEESGKYPFYVRSEKIERINTYSYNCEAVLTAGDGVGTGKVFHYVNGKFEVHQRVYIINEFSDKLDGLFFYLYFSNNFLERIKTMTAKSSVDSVRKDMINKMQIPLPLLYEQKKIASALISIDNLLLSLDKLIEKKKFIKQGAMQELLTGKKRLPGFTGEWESSNLGELCIIKDGTHQTPKYVENGIPFYSVENVTNNNFKTAKNITLKDHNLLTKNYRIEKGDVLMTRIGSIGICKYIDWEVNASFYVSLALLKFKDKSLARFFSFYSRTEGFIKEIESKSLQFATPKKINLSNISLVKIEYPISKEEQEMIISTLSSMDREIESLEGKKAKYEQIKQGMMQQLLTGKIRLI